MKRHGVARSTKGKFLLSIRGLLSRARSALQDLLGSVSVLRGNEKPYVSYEDEEQIPAPPYQEGTIRGILLRTPWWELRFRLRP